MFPRTWLWSSMTHQLILGTGASLIFLCSTFSWTSAIPPLVGWGEAAFLLPSVPGEGRDCWRWSSLTLPVRVCRLQRLGFSLLGGGEKPTTCFLGWAERMHFKLAKLDDRGNISGQSKVISGHWRHVVQASLAVQAAELSGHAGAERWGPSRGCGGDPPGTA